MLDRFARRYGKRGVTVLGIDVQDNSDDALAFLRDYDVDYPQLRSVGDERSAAFGSTGVPENFLVDPRGRLALIWRGPVDQSFLETRSGADRSKGGDEPTGRFVNAMDKKSARSGAHRRGSALILASPPPLPRRRRPRSTTSKTK